MLDHTPEPWDVDSKAKTRLVNEDDRTVATTGGHQNNMESDMGTGENRANARRIVACVNFCQGVSTEDLQALVDDDTTLPGLVHVLEKALLACDPETHDEGMRIIKQSRGGDDDA